jgi:threonine/homoserine/homoserine lactone efflux protein
MLGAPLLFSALKILGAVFLIYLGVGALLSGSAKRELSELASAGALKSVGTGFMVAFLNPKLMIFFTALFSQFVEPSAAWQQKLLLVVTPAAIDGLWYSIVAVAATLPWLVQRFAPWGGVLRRVFGGLLTLLGLQVLWLALS